MQTTAPTDIPRMLKQAGLEPKKSLGQNFMIDPAALEKLAEAAQISSADAVLEIGAGLGTLTAVLAQRAAAVTALEIDGRLIPILEAAFAGAAHVRIVQGDILQVDPGGLMTPHGPGYKVAANLPYYITSAVLRHLLEADSPPARLAVTVQREVAERMTAEPGRLSLLAISVAFYGQAHLTARLKPGSFFPRPEVDSAVVSVQPHPGGPPLPPDQARLFFRIVRAGFSQPRKQLKNTLSADLHAQPAQVASLLEQADIDPARRAETLSLAEWLALHHVFTTSAVMGKRIE